MVQSSHGFKAFSVCAIIIRFLSLENPLPFFKVRYLSKTKVKELKAKNASPFMYKKCKMYSSSSRWKISIRYLTCAFGSQKIINFLKKWTCQLIFASLKRFCLIVDNLKITIEIQ